MPSRYRCAKFQKNFVIGFQATLVLRTDALMDGQALIYRTLPAKAEGPITF